MHVGREMVTLMLHLRFGSASDAESAYPKWSKDYSSVMRGEYIIDDTTVKLGHGGELFARRSFLQSPMNTWVNGEIVMIANPRFIGCGSNYVVAYDDGSYEVVEPVTEKGRLVSALLKEWRSPDSSAGQKATRRP